jgi:hypothetical protein
MLVGLTWCIMSLLIGITLGTLPQVMFLLGSVFGVLTLYVLEGK